MALSPPPAFPVATLHKADAIENNVSSLTKCSSNRTRESGCQSVQEVSNVSFLHRVHVTSSIKALGYNSPKSNIISRSHRKNVIFKIDAGTRIVISCMRISEWESSFKKTIRKQHKEKQESSS